MSLMWKVALRKEITNVVSRQYCREKQTICKKQVHPIRPNKHKIMETVRKEQTLIPSIHLVTAYSSG